MTLPVVQGVIDRRILISYRVRPEVLARCLPHPFRPKIVRGVGVAGICLIRLSGIRPRGLPAFLGLSSENAAHRIAVEWEEEGRPREGVYIPRRDTSSRLNTWAGGKVYPGIHHHARFHVSEEAGRFRVGFKSDDGMAQVSVDVTVADSHPAGSCFRTLEDASHFFRGGALGYSVTPDPGRYDGLELRCLDWTMAPLRVDAVRSSFFDDEERFPKGTAVLDSGFLMRGVPHEWHEEQALDKRRRRRRRPCAPSSPSGTPSCL